MGKGEETRAAILDKAVDLASVEGLNGLSIGALAGALGLSKSGLFAHFGSKEALQRAVLEAAVARFTAEVWAPAMRAPRGLPRVEALFRNWLGWCEAGTSGGCPLVQAETEFDDQPGPLRDYLVAQQRTFHGAVARAVNMAIEQGHFRADLDPQQFAFELKSVILGFHAARRLFGDRDARRRAETAFRALVARSNVQA